MAVRLIKMRFTHIPQQLREVKATGKVTGRQGNRIGVSLHDSQGVSLAMVPYALPYRILQRHEEVGPLQEPPAGVQEIRKPFSIVLRHGETPWHRLGTLKFLGARHRISLKTGES